MDKKLQHVYVKTLLKKFKFFNAFLAKKCIFFVKKSKLNRFLVFKRYFFAFLTFEEIKKLISNFNFSYPISFEWGYLKPFKDLDMVFEWMILNSLKSLLHAAFNFLKLVLRPFY